MACPEVRIVVHDTALIISKIINLINRKDLADIQSKYANTSHG
jgi:hypothetical protein